jgi:hypothetical protein
MNKKLITGAVLALAAGLATFFIAKRRRKLSAVASDAYDTANNTMNYMERKTENAFSL